MAEHDTQLAALELIVSYSCMGTPWNAYNDLKRIAREALDATD